VGALIHFDCLDPFLFWNADGGKVFEPSAEIRKLIEKGAVQSFRSAIGAGAGGRSGIVGGGRSACCETISIGRCWALALTQPMFAAAPVLLFFALSLSLETDTISSLILLPPDERRLQQLLLPVSATAPLRLLADRQWVQGHDDVSEAGDGGRFARRGKWVSRCGLHHCARLAGADNSALPLIAACALARRLCLVCSSRRWSWCRAICPSASSSTRSPRSDQQRLTVGQRRVAEERRESGAVHEHSVRSDRDGFSPCSVADCPPVRLSLRPSADR
jgi:hypothetical protein